MVITSRLGQVRLKSFGTLPVNAPNRMLPPVNTTVRGSSGSPISPLTETLAEPARGEKVPTLKAKVLTTDSGSSVFGPPN